MSDSKHVGTEFCWLDRYIVRSMLQVLSDFHRYRAVRSWLQAQQCAHCSCGGGVGARGSDPVSRTAPAACTSGPTHNEPGGFECREGGVCAYPTQPDQPINVVAGRSRLDAISEGRNTRGKRRCSESTCRTARWIRTTTRQAVRAHTGYLGATWALRGRDVPATQCHDEDSKEEKSNRAPSSIVRQGY